jgi:phosphoglycerol transferase MdoB-like AlkP superfamily enzyme
LQQLQQTSWSYRILANPIVAFSSSVLFRDTPKIFTMATPVNTDDFAVAADHPPGHGSLASASTAPIRNVLIYVLESVPAEYVDGYGSLYHATPELAKRHASSLKFDSIYALVPNSPKALIALLLSSYGIISYEHITSRYPNIALPSLSSELKKQGYRTALFYGSDLHFANQDEFLSHRKFDIIQDYRARKCEFSVRADTLKEKDVPGGSSDRCTARALIKWIDAQPNKPFLGLLWTMQTHYPYLAPSQEIDFGVDNSDLNRYLNALHGSDAAFGEILSALDEDGLTDSTLVAVLGDHGEAFGRHQHWGHASSIYEENVHIPLILINPRLFNGNSNPVIGGLVDLAPTVIDLLGLEPPEEWQGRSLFERQRSPRAYFFSTWANVMLGYREGQRAYILNATEDRLEIYDVLADPQETASLASESPSGALAIRQRLAAWVQYQDRLMRRWSRLPNVIGSKLVAHRAHE